MPVNLSAPDAADLHPVAGLRIGTTMAGIRKANRRDLVVFLLEEGAAVAGVFTKNRFCAAPVQLCREHLAGVVPSHGIRALLVNTGNANAGTGADGLARARRGRIGIVLQAFHLIPTMTALENVAVPLELAGEADVQTRAKAELEAVGLGHRLHHYPTQLSGGEQQRVAIARALVGRPALIFADEPTGNLDAATGAAIIDLLFGRLTETGATLVLITHDADLAPLCDRIITMRDGLIVDDRMDLAQAAE